MALNAKTKKRKFSKIVTLNIGTILIVKKLLCTIENLKINNFVNED